MTVGLACSGLADTLAAVDAVGLLMPPTEGTDGLVLGLEARVELVGSTLFDAATGAAVDTILLSSVALDDGFVEADEVATVALPEGLLLTLDFIVGPPAGRAVGLNGLRST